LKPPENCKNIFYNILLDDKILMDLFDCTLNIVISRITNFLPLIASDNKELVKKDVKSIRIENVEGTERIIEMVCYTLTLSFY